jgi:hypothetical protein
VAAVTEEVPATEVVTPEALVVTTGVVTEGARWETPLTELAVPRVLVTAVVPAVATGIVLASAPVVAPTPTMSAPSDQFDIRRTRRRPLSRTDWAVPLSGSTPDPGRRDRL